MKFILILLLASCGKKLPSTNIRDIIKEEDLITNKVISENKSSTSIIDLTVKGKISVAGSELHFVNESISPESIFGLAVHKKSIPLLNDFTKKWAKLSLSHTTPLSQYKEIENLNFEFNTNYRPTVFFAYDGKTPQEVTSSISTHLLERILDRKADLYFNIPELNDKRYNKVIIYDGQKSQFLLIPNSISIEQITENYKISVPQLISNLDLLKRKNLSNETQWFIGELQNFGWVIVRTNSNNLADTYHNSLELKTYTLERNEGIGKNLTIKEDFKSIVQIKFRGSSQERIFFERKEPSLDPQTNFLWRDFTNGSMDILRFQSLAENLILLSNGKSIDLKSNLVPGEDKLGQHWSLFLNNSDIVDLKLLTLNKDSLISTGHYATNREGILHFNKTQTKVSPEIFMNIQIEVLVENID